MFEIMLFILSLLLFTPPPDGIPITVANAHRLERVGMIGDGYLSAGIAWSGDTLAVSSSLGIWLYNIDGSRELILQEQSRVVDVVFSPDGRLIYSGGHDGAVRAWDAETHEFVNGWDGGAPIMELLAHERYVVASIVPQTMGGELLLMNDSDVLRYTTEEPILRLAIHDNLLVVGGDDVLYIDLNTGEPVELPLPTELFRYSFTFYGDLVAGQLQDRLAIHEIESGERVQTLDVPRTYDTTFIDDHQLIISVPGVGVQLWDIDSGEKVRDLPSDSAYVYEIHYNGRLLAYSDLHSFEVRTLDQTQLFAGESFGIRPTPTIAFNAQGLLAFSNQNTSPTGLLLADLETGALQQLTERRSLSMTMAFNPAGDWLLTGDSHLRLWYVPDPVLDAVFPHDFVHAVTFHPDGTQFATGANVIRVWDFDTRELIDYWGENLGQVLDLAYSGDFLASAHGNGGAYLWDSDQPIQTWDQPTDELALKDGRVLLTGPERTAVYDLASGALVYEVTPPISSPVFSGTLLIGSDSNGYLKLFNADDGTLLASYPAQRSEALVAISPDGRYIVTGSRGLESSGAYGVIWIWAVPMA